MKDGFDIVIGNPPYVRQEEIPPPLAKAEEHDPDAYIDLKTNVLWNIILCLDLVDTAQIL